MEADKVSIACSNHIISSMCSRDFSVISLRLRFPKSRSVLRPNLGESTLGEARNGEGGTAKRGTQDVTKVVSIVCRMADEWCRFYYREDSTACDTCTYRLWAIKVPPTRCSL